MSETSKDLGIPNRSQPLFMYSQANYDDFDLYKESSPKWQLDYRLLNNKGFSFKRKSLMSHEVIFNRSQFNKNRNIY